MKDRALKVLLANSGEAELERYAPILAHWLRKVGCINDALVKPRVYRLFQAAGFHVVRNHFYGVLPDTSQLDDAWWRDPPYRAPFARVKKVDFDRELERLAAWFEDLRGLPRAATASGFYWANSMFPPLDALLLYGMIREHRPRRLLEVGSGFSTEIALIAAAHTGTELHAIEPFPTARLLARRSQLASLTQARVQDIDPRRYAELEAGDILFIDSTHASKLGSDVNHLVLEVLPQLRPGVMVHFHDIFLPHEYPRRWYDELSIFWNEQYLLLAYLLDNPTIEVLMPSWAISIDKKAYLAEKLAGFDIWGITENLGGASGASLWLRKL